MLEEDQLSKCLNCNYPLPPDARYCPRCSQKTTDGRVSVWNFFRDFFENLLNVDSKLFQTFLALFIPGKLTVEYFRGKHKSYANPVRLFLLAGITLFAIVIWLTDDIDFGSDKGSYQKKADIVKLRQVLDRQTMRFDTTFLDTTQYYKTDSLRRWILREIDNGTSDSLNISTLIGGDNNIRISAIDFVELNPNTLVERYDVKSGFRAYMFKQQIKSMKNGRGLFHNFLGRLPVMIFFMMPFLALILYLLYIRHSYYFVEHLVFAFHTHTFAFLLISILILVGKWLNGWGIAAFIISIFAYQFIAQKRYYQQGFFKTLLKFLMLNFLYLFVISIFFTMAVAISFALY